MWIGEVETKIVSSQGIKSKRYDSSARLNLRREVVCAAKVQNSSNNHPESVQNESPTKSFDRRSKKRSLNIGIRNARKQRNPRNSLSLSPTKRRYQKKGRARSKGIQPPNQPTEDRADTSRKNTFKSVAEVALHHYHGHSNFAHLA